MTRARLPFTRLQAFEAVSRHKTFKAARDELGGSNVYRHVAELEADLGVKLIDRSAPGRLTYAGKILATYLTNQFDTTAWLLAELRDGPVAPETLMAILQRPGVLR